MDLVEIIYNETISIFMKGLDNDETIKINFKKYLNNSYGHLDLSEVKAKNKLDVLISLEKNKWKNASANYKKSFIMPDENLNKISKISAYSYDVAFNRLKNGSLLENVNIDGYLTEMELLRSKVYDFNKFIANEYISEATLDFYYATGQSDDTSIRIGRIKENIQKK